MPVEPTAIPGLFVVRWETRGDGRGFFRQTYQHDELAEAVGHDDVTAEWTPTSMSGWSHGDGPPSTSPSTYRYCPMLTAPPRPCGSTSPTLWERLPDQSRLAG